MIDKNEASLAVFAVVEGYIKHGVEHLDAMDQFNQFVSTLSDQINVPIVEIIDDAIEFCSLKEIKSGNDEIISGFLKSYRVSKISRRRKGIKQQIFEASKGKIKLNDQVINEIGLAQNRARGKLYEQIGLVLTQYYLREIEKIDREINVITDKIEFECRGYRGTKTKRRFDLFLPDFQIGVEIKSGRIIYNSNIRNQIFKDSYLLQRGIVKDIWWFLFYGGSFRVLDELQRCGPHSAPQ